MKSTQTIGGQLTTIINSADLPKSILGTLSEEAAERGKQALQRIYKIYSKQKIKYSLSRSSRARELYVFL